MKFREAFTDELSMRHHLAAASVLLALYWALDRFLLEPMGAPGAAYESSSVLAHSLSAPSVLMPLLAMSLLPVLASRRSGWQAIGPARLRWVIGGLALAIAWAYSTYDFNHYLNHWHGWDRAILVATAFGVVWHPAFTGLFLVAATLIANQFAIPLDAYTWTDKRVVFRVLALFCVYLSVRVVWRINPRALILLMLATHAVCYLVPAAAKLELPWLEQDRLDNLWIAFHANGWLDQVSNDTAVSAAHTIGALNSALLWGTMLVELSPLLLLGNRMLAVVILTACILMHLSIFASSGIFFWKWIILGVLLGALLLGPELAQGFFGWRSPTFLVWLLIIYPTAWVMKPVRLAWLDTTLNNMYELRIEGASGRHYSLGRDQMSPFDVTFAQNRFAYLVPDRHFPMTGGATDSPDRLAALSSMHSADDMRRYQAKRGKVRVSERARQRFAGFMCRYFRSVEASGGKLTFPRWLAAPKHIWTWRTKDAFAWQEPVRSVRVRWVSTWYDGMKVHTLEDKEVVRLVLRPESDVKDPSIWTYACPP